jgi:hypothetical protein
MRHHRLILLTSLLLGACSELSPTLDFQRVRTEFEQALHTDRLYTGRISAAPSGYQGVMNSLPVTGITKLEPKLRPTAWMMRAVSEWRTGSFTKAKVSAVSGLAANPAPHSREQVMLTMIPALVTDAEVLIAWKGAGMAYTAGQYAAVESSYRQALRTLDAAQALMDSSTPEAARNFQAYHEWRVLFNWETIINSLKGGSAVVDEAIRSSRSHFGGRDLLDLANTVRQKVPPGDAFRVIMDAEMGSRP